MADNETETGARRYDDDDVIINYSNQQTIGKSYRCGAN